MVRRRHLTAAAICHQILLSLSSASSLSFVSICFFCRMSRMDQGVSITYNINIWVNPAGHGKKFRGHVADLCKKKCSGFVYMKIGNPRNIFEKK